MKLIAPCRFKSVGYFVLGSSNLTVSLAGILAYVRPRSSDLGMLAAVVEPRTATWFNVKVGETVIDVGAHIGRYTLVAARLASKVIAVEPEPSNFSMLCANIRLNGFLNVIALPVALSRDGGKRRFYLSDRGDTATSSLEREWRSKRSVGRKPNVIEVQAETLDNLIASFDLQVVDWLKIDVEGHEVEVLQGGSTTLRRTKRLIMEVSPGNEAICKSLLEDAGFTLAGLEHNGDGSNWLLTKA